MKIATIKKASENNQVHYQILPSAMLSGKLFLIEIQIMEIGKLMKSFCCTALGIRVVTCSQSNSEFNAAALPRHQHSPGSLECNVSAIILIISRAKSLDPLLLLAPPTNVTSFRSAQPKKVNLINTTSNS